MAISIRNWNTFLGVILVLLVSKGVDSRPRRHHNLQISRQTNTVDGYDLSSSLTKFALNTTEIFGMHLSGTFTISDGIRKEVLARFRNAYSNSNCSVATDSGRSCNRISKQIIAIPQTDIGRYSDGFSYDAARQFQKRQASSQLGAASCGLKFDCYSDDDTKKKIEQKCWLYDLYADIHDNQGSSSGGPQDQITDKISLHEIKVDGNELKWTDISDYMQKVGNKLVPTNPANSASIDLTKVYDEIKCEMKDINIDTRSNASNQIFDKHADQIQKFHNHLYQLKNFEKKGVTYDCYSELLHMMKHLTELAESNSQNWEDIMKWDVFEKIIKKLDDTTNSVHQYYTADKPEKNKIHLCHHQILIHYSSFVNERNLDFEDLKNDFGVNWSSPGVFENMTKNLFDSITKFLVKTLLMSAKQRYSDVSKEIAKSAKCTKEVKQKLYDSNFDAVNFWRSRIKRMMSQIKKARKLMTA